MRSNKRIALLIVFAIFFATLFNSDLAHAQPTASKLNANASCRVRGRLIDKNLGAITNNQIIFKNGRKGFSVLTDNRGEFQTDLPIGSYYVHSSWDGLRKITLAQIPVNRCSDEDLTFVLPEVCVSGCESKPTSKSFRTVKDRETETEIRFVFENGDMQKRGKTLSFSMPIFSYRNTLIWARTAVFDQSNGTVNFSGGGYLAADGETKAFENLEISIDRDSLKILVLLSQK